jgi:hypothetical protein
VHLYAKLKKKSNGIFSCYELSIRTTEMGCSFDGLALVIITNKVQHSYSIIRSDRSL